jgi:periplasmic protein TonB
MNSYFLPQSGARSRFVFFFLLAVVLHGAAAGVASLHRVEEIVPEPPTSAIDVDFQTSPEKDIALPLIQEADPLPPPPLAEAPEFVEPAASPAPTARNASPPQRLPRPPTPRGAVVRGGPTRALAIVKPRPEYPYEARRQRLTGTGTALMTVDPASGDVIAVSMSRSTGSAVLDNATLAALRRWRFAPGTVSRVECPITYTLAGASF